jgi:hypothetical protein
MGAINLIKLVLLAIQFSLLLIQFKTKDPLYSIPIIGICLIILSL